MYATVLSRPAQTADQAPKCPTTKKTPCNLNPVLCRGVCEGLQLCKTSGQSTEHVLHKRIKKACNTSASTHSSIKCPSRTRSAHCGVQYVCQNVLPRTIELQLLQVGRDLGAGHVRIHCIYSRMQLGDSASVSLPERSEPRTPVWLLLRGNNHKLHPFVRHRFLCETPNQGVFPPPSSFPIPSLRPLLSPGAASSLPRSSTSTPAPGWNSTLRPLRFPLPSNHQGKLAYTLYIVAVLWYIMVVVYPIQLEVVV